MRYILVILVVALLGIVGVLTLSNRGNKNNTSKTSTFKTTKIVDHTSNGTTRVTWTQQGKLVGEDQRKAVRIIITPTTRTIQLLSDYEEHVERSAEFNNSQAAFDTFIRALDHMNFGRERTVKQPDERAMCPFGSHYIYMLQSGSENVLRSWSDSCTAIDGTFGGTNTNAQDIRRLFQAQINNYPKFVSGTGL